MRLDLLTRSIRDGDSSASRHISRVEDGIVMNDHYPVRGPVDIELDCLGAELDGPNERRNRVFGQGVVCPPMGDCDRAGVGAGRLGQGFLGGSGRKTPNL